MPERARLRWAFDRVRAMSASEMLWRAGGALHARGERFLDRLGLAGAEPLLHQVTDPTLGGETILFGLRPAAFLPGESEEGRRELARVLDSAAPDGGPDGGGAPDSAAFPADWNRDPRSGRVFPLRHWSEFDYRRSEDAEAIRGLWYLARHRRVSELALPYYLAGEGGAAEEAASVIGGWIAQCPPRRGIHWLVPLELGLRLIAWSYAARLLRGSQALGALAPELARSVHLQAEHIRTHLSRHSSANNHLIGQAAGLVHAGIGFSGLERSGRWRDLGCEILWREILRQTTEDGVSREASTHYHEFVLELGLLVWLLLRAEGAAPPLAVRQRLLRMLEFMAELDAFPGGPPELGDSDGQSALPFAGATPGPRTLLALGAVLGRRGDWKVRSRGLTRQAAILLGEVGRAEFESLAAERTAMGSRVFPAAGYAFLRDASGERAVLLDGGELGYLSTAAHAHADSLSIVLGAFGQRLLVDPGTYTYHAEPEMRDFFRSTAAHNTLRVDGEDQSEMLGPFLWGKRARGRLVDWMHLPAIDLVAAEHDGYRRLPDPVVHRRTLVFVKPDYLWVIDDLEGSGEHLVEQFLHFGEAMVKLGASPGQVLAQSSKGPALWVHVLGDPEPEIELWSGSERPLQGWLSPSFGKRQPEVVWRRVVTCRVPAELGLLLRPLAAVLPMADPAPGAAILEAWASGRALHVRGMPGEDLVCLAGAGAAGARGIVSGGGMLAGEAALAGRLGLVRFGNDGLAALAGDRLERLEVGGEILAEVEGGPASFCLRRLGDRVVVEGMGGRVHVRGASVRGVRGDGSPLAIQRSGDWLSFELASAGDGEEPGGESRSAGGPVL